MNILVDARMLHRFAAGIHTFFKGALLEWVRIRPQDVFYLVVPKGIDPRAALNVDYENIQYVFVDNPLVSKLPNIVILQSIMPFLARKYQASVYFSPVPYIPLGLPSYVKTVIVAHDVVNIEYKATMSWTNKLANTCFFDYAIKHCDLLWCNSEYTKSKILEYFPQRKCKEPFVGCAVDRTTYNLNEPEEYINNEIVGKYVLFVGSLEPRKNLAFLLQLVPTLYSEHGIQLVVVGGNRWKSSDLADLVNQKDYPQRGVVFCDYISNQELSFLYHHAQCLVSSSLNEGFGMPQLESMLCGCPVVTSHNSAMIEIAEGNDSVKTLVGYNKSEWIDAILETINTEKTVDQRLISKYDWSIVVPNMLSHFNNN